MVGGCIFDLSNKENKMNNATTTTAKPFSWMNEPELMARLSACQNNGKNDHQDIMTYAGWCGSREALVSHVELYEARA